MHLTAVPGALRNDEALSEVASVLASGDSLFQADEARISGVSIAAAALTYKYKVRLISNVPPLDN